MKIKQLTTAAMMLALLIVCSQLSIPLPGVPLTLQTFAVGMVATLLPLSDALTVIAVYLLAGAVGIPVFANFTSGVAVLLSPLGGYLFGFVVYVLVTKACLSLVPANYFGLTSANLLGAASQLVIGALWMIPFAKMSLNQALLTGVIPFVLPGLIKAFLVTVVCQRLFQTRLSFK